MLKRVNFLGSELVYQMTNSAIYQGLGLDESLIKVVDSGFRPAPPNTLNDIKDYKDNKE